MGGCCSQEQKSDDRTSTRRTKSTSTHHSKRRKRTDDDFQRSDSSGDNSAKDEISDEPKPYDVYVALFKYTPGSTSEVALEKGERVEILNREAQDFVFVRQLKLHHGTRGYVPIEYLAMEGSGLEEDFFYGQATRREATKVLQDESITDGTFIVRTAGGLEVNNMYYVTTATTTTSEESLAPFAITLKCVDHQEPGIYHFRVLASRAGDAYFLTRGTQFETLRKLITHYQGDEAVRDLPCTLKRFVPRPVPPRRAVPIEMRERWREIPREQLKLADKLGDGKFGEVHKAIWTRVNGDQVIVVVKHLKKLSTHGVQALLDEASMMKDLRHENIVKLYGVVSASDPCYLVSEFVKDRSLLEYLSERQVTRLPLAPAALFDICIQICKGMEYLAKKRIVHRDLAARNILINVISEQPFSCNIKVADFGLARALKEEVYKMRHQTYIALKWLAPEGLGTVVFSTESDVWAFGVTMAEIFGTGVDPWREMTEPQVKKRILSGRGPKQPREMPDSVYKVMKMCCQSDPKKRPSFTLLVKQFEELLRSESLTKSKSQR